MTVKPLSIDAVKDWLVTAGLAGMAAPELLRGLGERLNLAGLGIGRIYMAMTTLHPMLRALGYTYERGSDTIVPTEFAHSDLVSEAWKQSPFAHMIEHDIQRMRRRLAGPKAEIDFPVLQEFADQGLTDWLAALVGFRLSANQEPGELLGLVLSAACDRPGGWSDAERDALESILPQLGLAIQGRIFADLAGNLLGIYLGADAAQRVLNGATRRGDLRKVTAALLYADLRGFTALSATVAPETLIDVLDRHLDCIVGPIERHGGQVLKFMGDGLLAIFPTERAGPGEACRLALAAAEEAQRRVAAIDGTALPLCIALHLGEVLYGNVGSDTRLDFTVIGPAVNEAARMEALCKAEALPVLVSEPVSRALGTVAGRLESIGLRRLPGIEGGRELFSLRPAGP